MEKIYIGQKLIILLHMWVKKGVSKKKNFVTDLLDAPKVEKNVDRQYCQYTTVRGRVRNCMRMSTQVYTVLVKIGINPSRRFRERRKKRTFNS